MPSPKQPEEVPTSQPDGFVRKSKPRRFYWQRLANGGKRAIRSQSKAKGERDQALSDFFGASPDMNLGSNLRRIESIVSELSARYDVVEESIAPEILASAWHEAMGDYIATQAQLISISNAKATVRCLHPALRFELNKRKKSIITMLNKRFGEGSVKYVRLIHG